MNDKSWRDYLRPVRQANPFQPCKWAFKERTCAAWVEEQHAEVAEYRLRHDGIKPELVRYLRGIGEAFRCPFSAASGVGVQLPKPTVPARKSRWRQGGCTRNRDEGKRSSSKRPTRTGGAGNGAGSRGRKAGCFERERNGVG